MAGRDALVKVSSIHRYATEQLAATLASAERLEQTAAGLKDLPPTQTILLNQLNRALLWHLLGIVQQGGMRLVDALPYPIPVAQVERQIYRQIDQFVQRYLQHVQTILRR